MSKLRKNDNEFKVVGRGGLSGAVGCVFDCCPKGRGFDTQLRRLVFGVWVNAAAGMVLACIWVKAAG